MIADNDDDAPVIPALQRRGSPHHNARTHARTIPRTQRSRPPPNGNDSCDYSPPLRQHSTPLELHADTNSSTFLPVPAIKLLLLLLLWNEYDFMWRKIKATRPHYKCHDESSRSNHGVMCSWDYFRKAL